MVTRPCPTHETSSRKCRGSSFDVPGKAGGLLDVFRWHYLLQLLVRTGVTTRYRNSVLGWTWSYVRPAAQFLVFWVVLGLFLQLETGHPELRDLPVLGHRHHQPLQ